MAIPHTVQAVKNRTVDGSEEGSSENVRIVRLNHGTQGAGRAVGQLPDELFQAHIDGEIPEGEVDRALLTARNKEKVVIGIVLGAKVVCQSCDDLFRKITESRAGVEEDGQFAVHVYFRISLSVCDTDLVECHPVSCFLAC